ncbi:MAG: hypothetical protein LBV66_02950 [Elusimicrobiota bacterium]|jgi:hypothetical protein|nr:hypothetical protein [Elusimicrobiota bacterium]
MSSSIEIINKLKNNSGQTLVELSLSILFITMIMFAFFQLCLSVVDDLTANEAAFVSMRSDAVTKSSDRNSEAKEWIKSYFSNFTSSVFANSTKSAVENFTPERSGNSQDPVSPDYNSNDSVVLFSKDIGKSSDGGEAKRQTVEFYYTNRVLFGSLTAPFTSSRGRRYQAARSRLIPSPNEKFYAKSVESRDTKGEMPNIFSDFLKQIQDIVNKSKKKK